MRIRFAGLRQLLSGKDAPAEYQRSLAFLRTEVGISGTLGKAICLTDNGAAHDFNVQIQIQHHAFDDCQLLGIFLAEICPIGCDDVEQLGNHSADTAEVHRTAQTAQFLGEDIHVHEAAKALGVHFLRCGVENQIYTHGIAQCRIVFQITGVAGEILVGAELGGVNKDADDHTVILFPCTLHQAAVSFMKIAHGWNKGNGQSLFFPLFYLFPYFCNGFYNFHHFSSCSSCAMISSEIANSCSFAGKLPSCTAS